MALQWARVCVRIEALHEFEWGFRPSNDFTNGDFFGVSRQTHASIATAQGFDVAALAQIVGDLHQMRPRNPVRPGNIVHCHDFRRAQSQKLEGAKGEVRVLGQPQSMPPVTEK
jgi:hypothetical protein